MYIGNPETALIFAKTLKRKVSGANAVKFKNVDIAVAPPAPFIVPLLGVLKRTSVRVGAQALSPHTGGAHTGDISGEMVKRLGGAFAIVGHSERRAAGEGDDAVHEELKQALDAGLRAVLCIGERQRDEHGEHYALLASQLQSALAGASAAAGKQLVIAYEPIWAIGKTAEDAMQPAAVRETVIFIRKTLADILPREAAVRVPVLYGGSVEPANAQALIGEGEVSGFLVGHASADIDSFMEIISACK